MSIDVPGFWLFAFESRESHQIWHLVLSADQFIAVGAHLLRDSELNKKYGDLQFIVGLFILVLSLFSVFLRRVMPNLYLSFDPKASARASLARPGVYMSWHLHLTTEQKHPAITSLSPIMPDPLVSSGWEVRHQPYP